MKGWLQHQRYALAVTIRRLGQHPFSFLSNLVVLSLVLSMPLLGASVLFSVQPLSKEVSTTPAITIFLDPNASLDTAKSVVKKIEQANDPDIHQITLIDKAQAIDDLKRNAAWEQALSVLSENPLPHAIVVYLANEDHLAQTADTLSREWRNWPEVAFVQLDSIWVQRLEALMRLAKIGLLLITGIVALVVLSAVFNTVRMQALSQRDEIAVARLVGATENFVRRPFLYQGAITCALATLIAIVLSHLFLEPLNAAVGHLAKTYDAIFVLNTAPGGLLWLYFIGASLLGALSARWSVTRHTRF